MTRKAIASLPCVAVLLCLFATGCGRFKKPSTVVHSLYMDCNNGEYPKARSLFTAELRDTFDGAGIANGPGIKAVCDRLTNSGSIADVAIESEVIHGETATVLTDLRFQDNTMKYRDRTDLIQEDGAWKVTQ
jgi:hypothetical protein